MKRLFSLLALMLSVSIGFADTVTFDYANYLSKLDSRGGTYGNTSTNIGDISVTVTSSGSGSVSQNNGATLKFQVNTSFTISGEIFLRSPSHNQKVIVPLPPVLAQFREQELQERGKELLRV